MNSYEPIQKHIDRAGIGRTVRIADGLAEGLFATWNAVTWFVSAVIAAERAKDPNKVFTFEA